MDIIMRRKISTFGHITRHDSSASTILHGYVEGKRKRGRPKRNRENAFIRYIHHDIFEFSNISLRQLFNIVKDRSKCRKLLSSLSRDPPTMSTALD